MPAKGSIVRKDKTLLRQAEVLELRRNGFSFPQIANYMVQKYGTDLWEGYDDRSAYYDAHKALKREAVNMHETAKEVMQLDLSRLDEMLMSIYPAALNGDYKAIDRILKIMKHRAALLGLEQAKTVKIQDWRTEIIELVRRGEVTPEQVKDSLGNEQYEEIRELIESRSSVIVESRFVEETSIENNSE